MKKGVDEISILKKDCPKAINSIVHIEKKSGMPGKFKVPSPSIKLWRIKWH
jgi:hypothetical protein